ncbi:uncharacterized protein LOC125432197 [Sphaerodactylus townsendi]|uniref:uncharacterized protein LOC125432197 n=1 Tax=Sphaerodactylus townsendi TaxID=933632 RepID=UPI0020268BF8|nr:uncharacterized protein LOC125432197 [Sphaerodactylus townsendi]
MKKGDSPCCTTILAIILVFGGWDEASGQAVRLHSNSPGRLNRCRSFPISSDYCSFVPSANLNSTLEDSEICNFTLPQYACGLVSNLTSSQLSTILRCHTTDAKAQLDQESFLRLFGLVDQGTLQSALSEITSKIPQDLIPETSKAFMLNAVWEKLKTDPRVQNAGFLSAWLQELLYPYLTGISTNVLDCLTQLPITCDGFAVVIQALDSRSLEMDNSTRQTVVSWIGRFLAKHACQKSTPQEWILNNWRRFLRFVSYGDLLKAWGASDGSAFLTEAEGGALEYMTPSQVAEMTATAGVLSNVNLTRVVTRVLLGKDARYLEAFLGQLVAFPLNPEREASRLMLETVLRKVNQSFPDLCSPSLKDLFQMKLKAFLPDMDAEMLELIPTQIGCADFQDIYEGISHVDSELDLDTKKALFKSRLAFLTRQLEKEGTACTFAVSNSKEWLQKNFGSSSPFANYGDFRRLYPAFEGYEVLDLLTATQMASLVIYSGILTDSTRLSAETEARKVMETLQGRAISELQTFLLEVRVLAEQGNIVEKVRSVMLQGIWQILKAHFDSMAVTDFEPWFSGALTPFLPSVTTEQLRALPSPSNCTQLQTVAKGLDYAFGPMSAETRIGAAQWIVQEFKKQGCQTTGSWMTLNFLRFKSLVNLTDLMEMDQNFSGMAHLQDLSAVQLAQLTLTEEVFGSVVNVKLVFDRLAQLSTREDLEAYWDEFNRVYAEANRRYAESQTGRLRKRRSLAELNISLEVKQTLLSRTIQWLHRDLLTFTDADYKLWFEKRLAAVLPSVTADILQQIPVNLSCAAYKSVMAGIDVGFPEITKDRKREILNYIESFLNQKSEITGPACAAQITTREWLLQFFRSFSTQVAYTKLVSYFRQPFDAYLVLDLLTPSQIGDMIVHSQTLTSVPLATQLIAFFREYHLDSVQTILQEFTRAAVQHKMLVLPNPEVAQLLLTSYLSLASSQMETYTAADWNATFHGELRFLSAFINATTLSYIIPQDFESITTIIAELSKVHAQMTETSRRAIVLWIVQNSKDLKASGYQNKSVDERIQAVWGSFFLDATLEEVKSTNEDFRPASNLGSLNIGQLVEFVTASDALVNVTTMRTVLSSLENERSEIPLSQMQDFLTHFNLEIEQNKVDIGEGVRLEILNTIFTHLKTHFRTFTHLDYSVWFSKMKFLLPSINKDVLQLIPLDLGFPSYTAIITGLDQASSEFSQETSHEVYTFMKKILEVQVNISGTAFPGAYKDSQSFLSGVFSRFARFAEYTDFITFYKDFNGYDVLPLLTTKQMSEMMVVTNAIQRELLAVQILVELEKRPLDELKVFTSELNVVMHQKGSSFLPDLQVSTLILEAVFKRLQFATFSAVQYDLWFGTQLKSFLPALSLRLLHQIPLDVDCQSHQNLVNALDQVYTKFTMDQKEAIHKRILNYLEFYQQNQGATCLPTKKNKCSQWLTSQ